MQAANNVISYAHIPIVPYMKERSEVERRALTWPAAGLVEWQSGVARSAAEGGAPSYTIAKMKTIELYFFDNLNI